MAELLLDVLYCGVDRFVVIGIELKQTSGAFRVLVVYLLERGLALCGITRANEDVVVGRVAGEECRSVETNATIGTYRSKHVLMTVWKAADLPVIKMI
jgi:hypothetical protein